MFGKLVYVEIKIPISLTVKFLKMEIFKEGKKHSFLKLYWKNYRNELRLSAELI